MKNNRAMCDIFLYFVSLQVKIVIYREIAKIRVLFEILLSDLKANVHKQVFEH